ncbi:MAG: hypothetical protein AVDCRST_MAG76-3326, partial [uncultured Acidimicrobiales bacterium]
AGGSSPERRHHRHERHPLRGRHGPGPADPPLVGPPPRRPGAVDQPLHVCLPGRRGRLQRRRPRPRAVRPPAPENGDPGSYGVGGGGLHTAGRRGAPPLAAGHAAGGRRRRRARRDREGSRPRHRPLRRLPAVGVLHRGHRVRGPPCRLSAGVL